MGWTYIGVGTLLSVMGGLAIGLGAADAGFLGTVVIAVPLILGSVFLSIGVVAEGVKVGIEATRR